MQSLLMEKHPEREDERSVFEHFMILYFIDTITVLLYSILNYYWQNVLKNWEKNISIVLQRLN